MVIPLEKGLKREEKLRIREEVLSLKPYFIDEKQVKFKLDANESPFDLSEEDKAALLNELKTVETNRYPDPSTKNLRMLLAKKEGLSSGDIVFGNGSDEIIYMLLLCLNDRAKVMYPEPGFSMYGIGAKIFGKLLIPYKLNPPYYNVDGEEFLKQLTEENPDLVFVANPNNPTGNLFPFELLTEALKTFKDTIFVSDEAYFDYAGQTMLPEVRNHDNLLVMRSFSKIGFASIRLGYLVGRGSLIEAVSKVRLPYNINSYTQKVAEFFLKRNDLVKNQISDIIKERERVFNVLTGLNIFTLPSLANFVTFKIEKSGFYNFLLDNGVLIKELSHSFGMKNFYRMTIGKKEENDFFLKLLKNFIEGAAL